MAAARRSVHFDLGESDEEDDYFHDDEHDIQEFGETTAAAKSDGAEEMGNDENRNATKKSSPKFPLTNPTSNSDHSYTASSMICPNCGSREIDQQDSSGASVCMSCGVVVEESAIVSSVEFVEGAGGASSMVGQFVSATSSKAYTGGSGGGGGRSGGGGGGSRYGFGRDSRENTLANGRRRIQEVASRLRLGGQFVDAAHRLFTIAVERNFVQGRRTTHVVAACLYIACRQEKSQHMLIDFSDALQVNVYTLGTCFLKFRRLLGLKLEIIDPALYVYRFAAHLDLDSKANAVSLTALRLVARMKRDWMVAGRRPAGICAAALLIAARAHGFDKHHYDVTRILRVCGLTVTTRVKEFEQTPTAQLTLDQFHKVDLPEEADPPIFTRNKYLEARAKAIREGNIELLASGALDDPMDGKRAKEWRNPKHNEKTIKFQQLYDSLQAQLVKGASAASSSDDATSTKDVTSQDETREGASEKINHEIGTVKASNNGEAEESPTNESPTQHIVVPTLSSKQCMTNNPSEGLKQIYPKSKEGKALVLPEDATPEELRAPTASVEARLDLNEWKRQIPETIDKEIEGFFRTEEEEKQKEIIFNKLNKDYIDALERKESEKLSASAAEDGQEKDMDAQAAGHARYNKRRKRGGKGNGDGTGTTEEQLLAAVSSRKVSRKINYDALSSIFDQDGSFATSTDVHQDGMDAGVADPVFDLM